MKTTSIWLLMATLSSGLLAQTVTNLPPAVPIADAAPAPMAAAAAPALTAPATPAGTNAVAATPVARKKKASSAKGNGTTAPKAKSARTNAVAAVAAAKVISLVPGPAVIGASNVNVRGQANLSGEVITKLTAGEPITVLESVIIEKPKQGEPAQWAKIAFPTNVHVWVHSSFVDPTNKTVKVSKLNLRAGPGENYSVVGALKRGDAINEMLVKESWIEIPPPAGAFAFIAAEYVKQVTPEAPVTKAEPATAPAPDTNAAPATTTKTVTPAVSADTNVTTTAVAPGPTVAIAPMETTNAAVAVTATNEPTPAVVSTLVTNTNEPAPTIAINTNAPQPKPEFDPALPKRIVQREGIVRGTWSIQAPSPVELVNLTTGESMDFLYSPSTEVNLKRYKGLHVLVTGEEGLDRRWPNMPVLIIQRIQVVEQ